MTPIEYMDVMANHESVKTTPSCLYPWGATEPKPQGNQGKTLHFCDIIGLGSLRREVATIYLLEKMASKGFLCKHTEQCFGS
jgi:hypothetical protein